MAVLITAPPICLSVRPGEYPPTAVSDKSKPAGGVTVISPLKPVPATVNLPTLGLSLGDPTQPMILPVMVLVVMTGVGPELTVILKVIGELLQPEPGIMKLPKDTGKLPAGIVKAVTPVVVLITDITFSAWSVTYKLLLSGLKESPVGERPVVKVAITVLVVVLITDAVLSP